MSCRLVKIPLSVLPAYRVSLTETCHFLICVYPRESAANALRAIDRVPKPKPPIIVAACFTKIFPQPAQTAPPRQSHKSGPNHRTVGVRAHRFPKTTRPGLSLSAATSLPARSLHPNRSARPARRRSPESRSLKWDNEYNQEPACRCSTASLSDKFRLLTARRVRPPNPLPPKAQRADKRAR